MLGNFTSVFVGWVPGHFWLDGHHNMEPLAARCFRPGIKPFSDEHIAQTKRRLDHKFPIDAFAWVEIEDQSVGMLYIVDLGTPRMDLHHLHLNEPEQPGLIIDPHPCALATFALFDPKLMHPGWDRGQRSHVIEGCAVDASDQLQRSAS